MGTILFVCPHGAAKSVLAAAMFQQLADQRGLVWRAASAGTDPDPNFPAAVVEFLRSANLPLPSHTPRLVTEDDLKTAFRIVSFSCNLNDRALPHTPILHWDEVPPVSQDLLAATRDLWRRVEGLVAELAAASPTSSED